MAATSKFENVLNFISNSKLNFSIYKTPFSAQISLKNSYAKYFDENEDLVNVTSELAKNNDNIVPQTVIKSEPVKLEELAESTEESEKLKAIIEINIKELDDLRNQKTELESKLKETKKESKKNRQRADKLHAMLDKMNFKEPDECIAEASEDIQIANLETQNKFCLLSESSNEQLFSEVNPPCTQEREVQTEMIFSPYDCFHCEKRLQSQDQVKTHKELCKGRPWDSFSCDQCSLNFRVASHLKQHVEKVHDPAKLLYCLQELYKPKVKNFKCTDCDTKFEFDSELELHELTSHGAWKERFGS